MTDRTLRFRSYGRTIAVRAPSEVWPLLEPLLPPGWRAAREGPTERAYRI